MGAMQKQLIVGWGEIGKAIGSILSKNNIPFDYHDLKESTATNEHEYSFCHVAIPYNDKFDESVQRSIDTFKPEYVIIHSTISPDSKIAYKENVVISPIKGVHPNLEEGIMTFEKYIGGNIKAINAASLLYKKLGIKAHVVSAKEAIYAKLLSTQYYGINICYADYVNKICQKEGISFNNVYTEWNHQYNEGYKKLGMDNVIRPVLYPPKEKIFGHCIAQNTEIIEKNYPSPFIDMIQDLNKTHKNDNN